MENKLDKLKTVVVSVRLDTEDYRIVAAQAKKEMRSFNNQIRYIVRQYIDQRTEVKEPTVDSKTTFEHNLF